MKTFYLLVLLFIATAGFSQTSDSNIFNRISESMKTFEIDTSDVPKDKLTEKIIELRNLKGGFNINEAMEYKIAEARSKNELSETEYINLNNFLTLGNGKRWIDNSMIWIYRKHFTYSEIKQLIKFYKTSAGRKMAIDFPIIMFQSIKAAESIIEKYKENK